MEPEKNAVVFGVGGAGCKALNLISRDCPADTELVAVDIDAQQLGSLEEGIERIQIGQSIDDASDIDSAKSSIMSDLGNLEEIINGARLVVVIAGLGRKTGTYVSCKIAEKAVDMGRMCIGVPIYPFQTKKARTEEANNAIAKLKEVSNGIIIADNNSKRKSKDMPVIDVFREVNFQISKLVCSLVNSVNGMCDMSVSLDELRSFFYGGRTCIMASGEGSDLDAASQEAIKELNRYVEEDSVKNLMVLVKSPYELQLSYVRNLAEELEGRYEPEELKWVAEGSGSGDYHVLVIAAVAELPLVDSLPLPDHVECEKLPEEVLDEVEKKEQEPQALIGLHFMEEGSLPGLPNQEESLPGVTQEEESKTSSDDESLPGLPGLMSDEEATSWDMDESEMDVSSEESVNKTDTVEDDVDDVLEEMAAELTGFPIQRRESTKRMIKKRAQKKLDEYDDDLGIDFI